MRLAILVIWLALFPVLARPARAADCDGADVTRLRLSPDRLGFEGTVSRAGLTHDTLADAGFALRIVDAEDDSVLYQLHIPPARFVSNPKATVYDGNGTFRGTVRLTNAVDQADTVVVKVRANGIAAAGTGTARDLRVRLDTGTRCALSCVSACASNAGRLACDRSAAYVPFADAGFGARRHRARRPASAYCGLHVAADDCDFLIDERCILPYPSSHFLEPDASTPTGLRLHYPADGLPANTGGKHIDPTDWNTLDGYSPGPMIIALFPDTGFPVDLVSSGAAFHTDFAASLDEDNATVLVDDATGERVVHFAEMDANTNDVTKKALIVRPGVRLRDASHYVVGIRDLVDTVGNPIRPRLAFRALRDGVSEEDLARACGRRCAAAVEARRAGFEDTFATLADTGVARQNLLLAWDFTTASSEALTDWIVAVRDQAFALGTPSFTVTSVNDNGGNGINANIHTRIEGTFQAPLFMTADAPASRLNLVNGVPAQNGFATVPYVVEIPHVAINVGGQPQPGRPTLWGHGLLGDRFQLRSLSQLAQGFNFVIAAVDMQGMSSADVGLGIIPLIQDYSLFHRIPERLHQGFLNHLLLGRLLVDPANGFNSHPSFRFGSPATGIIDTTAVYYSGGSQGGIFGTAIMSVAEDFERGFLAVPGANYSTLLHRSIDFNPFLALHRVAYPDRLDETLIVPLVQQLWDRAEPQGYYPHLLSGDLSDPPRPHEVLMHMARYDSEVSNLATEIMVRSLGFPQVAPVINHFFDIPEQTAPFDGSALVEIDPQLGFSRCIAPGSDSPGAACTTNADCPGAGDPPSRTRCDPGIPPLSNTPPTFNNRAHGSTGVPTAGQQIDAFLRPGGRIEQFCTGTCDPQ
jgi:hypothetical protein